MSKSSNLHRLQFAVPVMIPRRVVGSEPATIEGPES